MPAGNGLGRKLRVWFAPPYRRRRLNLFDLQSLEGYWSLVGQATHNLDSTAERVVWIDEIHRAVCCA